jgi:integrase
MSCPSNSRIGVRIRPERSPERLGPEHIRQYQAYLFRERKLSAGTIEGRTAALRFLFVKTLRRPYLPDHIPFPKRQRRLPTILDQQEVARLIDSAGNLMHRTMLMMLYATGLRRAEMCHLRLRCPACSATMLVVERLTCSQLYFRSNLTWSAPRRSGDDSS